MIYSTVSLSSATSFAVEITANQLNQTEQYMMNFISENVRNASSPGAGAETRLNLDALDTVSESITSRVKKLASGAIKGVDKDKLEGQICSEVYMALEHVPVEILDDAGFWRFIGIRYFWSFTLWRESKALKNKEANSIAKYFSAKSSSESIPLRLYLRAQAMRDATGNFSLAEAVPKGTDFWRSHIIRVRTGRARALAQAFVKLQNSERMKTKDLRRFAKRINRQWSNVIMLDYDDKQSEEILREIKESLE